MTEQYIKIQHKITFNTLAVAVNKIAALYLKFFPNYALELDKAVGNCKTLLDVGCGSASPIQGFSSRLHSVGVDIFEPSLHQSREQKIHNDYVKLDVLEIDKKFAPGSFECVLASDLIEHLSKDEGNELLDKMEKIAEKRIIIFTPNGFLAQPGYDGNPWQEHKSGWTIQEMENKGYKVMGINGWKPLREELAHMKFWPKFFWRIVSDITQRFTKTHPEFAFQILCVKDKPSII